MATAFSRCCLPLLRQPLEEVASDDRIETDDARARLRELVSDRYMGLGAHAVRTFIEELGEAHFQAVAARACVELAKLREESNKKTPDFVFSGGTDVHFEVKTPSVADGEFRFKQDIEDAWQGRLEQQAQLDAGDPIAFFEHWFAPYGDAPDNKQLTCAIAVLSSVTSMPSLNLTPSITLPI